MAVLDAGRTRALARTATETTIDVARKGRRRRAEPPFFHRAHQVEASTRAVVLIAGMHIGRARFEAEAAVNTREKFILFRGQSAREL
jgi:hypothetical protein